MIGRTNTGGGNVLNYKVVRYASEAELPETAKENTIAVFTEVEISSHIFSPVEPSEPAEGMVWFITGTSSIVSFNALKKNGIEVYPLSAKQYVDGAWVSKTAKSYQNGEWVDWFTYLYHLGDTCDDLTGGWQARAWATTSSLQALKPSITFNADNITASVTNSLTSSPYQACGAVECKKDFDLTPYSTLCIDFSATHSNPSDSGINPVYLYVCGRSGAYAVTNRQAYAVLVTLAETSVSRRISKLDVSNITGEWDVCAMLSAKNGGKTTKIIIYDVWVE